MTEERMTMVMCVGLKTTKRELLKHHVILYLHTYRSDAKSLLRTTSHTGQ